MGYSPCGRKELDTTERLHSLSSPRSQIFKEIFVRSPGDCRDNGIIRGSTLTETAHPGQAP